MDSGGADNREAMFNMFAGVSRYARRYKWTIALLVFGLTFESLYDVALRYSLKFVVDTAVVSKDFTALVYILLVLAAGAVLFNFVVIGCDYMWARTGGRIINDLRADMFRHLQALPVGYHKRQSAGDLMARFNADVAQIEEGMILALPMAAMGIVEIVLTLALMAFLHPLLCSLAAAGIVVSLMIPQLIQGAAVKASFQLRREEGHMIGFLQENLTGQSVIKAYSLEAHASRDFGGRLDKLLHIFARANFLAYLVSRVPSLTFLLLQLVVLGVGGWLAIQGRITVGDLVAYQALLIGLNMAIFNLTWMIPSFIQATAGWQRIREILDEPLGIADVPGAQDLTNLDAGIELDKVRFSYPGSKEPALQRVDLKIEPGEYVVFVGRSGSGKSSIINLLLRFYETTEGEVRIGGMNVRDITMSSLRAKIGLVSQDITLFDIPVAENIRLGNLDASEEEIMAAAKSAEIHDHIVTMPEGYDSLAGPGGSKFSGGERQRVALARALVRKPAIMVLDEFSSALDPTTEADILKTIERLKGTCTIISVTHRLSMAEAADKVVVMRRGRIVEMGKHDELLAKNGEYARLWKRSANENTAAEKAGERAADDAAAAAPPSGRGA
ncbi:MAG: ABC transporter ATP-binding protein [Beijerinckiaceae bacterium]